jgi:hypothetical protein
MSKPVLKLDWCSHEAAKYACEKWHYSGRVPTSKSARIGVWENGEFVGAVVFSWGANPSMARTLNLAITECAELTRVALRYHAAPVSRILSLAFRILKKQSPGLRCLVSYADPDQGHHGGIYQGGNWIYVGTTATADDYFVRGRRMHRRALNASRKAHKDSAVPAANALEWIRKVLDPSAKCVRGSSKHKYLMPLDAEMKARIAPLARPYPKRPCAGSADSGTSAIQAGGGGANPTPALSTNHAEG